MVIGKKRVVLIKISCGGIRLPKEIGALKKEGYTITLLCRDEHRNCSKPKKSEENARKKAQELSWDNIAKKHIEVYEEAIHRRKIE